jgi:hypothetical protein
MDNVIIDTSAWIEAFRPKGDAELGHVVKDLIISGRIFIPGIIKTELLRGSKTEHEYHRLNDLLKGLTPLPVSEDYWERLATFSYTLFREGLTIPLTDTYIALLAIESGAALLHRDAHFDMIAGKTSLKIYQF